MLPVVEGGRRLDGTAGRARSIAADLRDVERIGLIGDVHTEDALLERAIRELVARGAERLLCVGDISNGLGDLARCCDLLRRHGVLAVRGNHDRWLLADVTRDLSDPEVRRRLPAGVITHLVNLRQSIPAETIAYLGALPATLALSTRRGIALLCHGLDANDLASLGPDDDGYALETNDDLHALQADPEVQIVLNGHTHRRMVRHLAGLTVVNAGTLRADREPGVVLLNVASGDVTWLDLGAGGAPEVAHLGSLGPAIA
jgi:predicted phosphodiesterase